MSVHITPQWQDVTGGYSPLNIRLADHVSGGIEARKRVQVAPPSASDPGDVFLVASTPQRIQVGNKLLWMKSAATQFDVVVTSGATASTPLGEDDWIGFPWIDAVEEGAIADAVQNPTTGAWSGTSQTALFQSLAAQASATKRKLFYRAGDYFMDVGLFPNQQAYSDIHVEGAGYQTRFIVKGNQSVWRTFGSTDNDSSNVVWLTVDAPQGSRTITVNNGALLTVNKYITLKDNSQPVRTFDQDHPQCAVLGEINRIQSIAGNVVTLWGATEHAYTADLVTPLNGTAVRRWTNPATNIRLARFMVEFDQTTTYTNINRVFEFQRVIGLELDHIRVVGSHFDTFPLNDVLYARLDVEDLDGTPDRYSVKLSNGTSRFDVKCWCRGGRHATTTTTSTTSIEVSHGIVHDSLGEYSNISCFDTHPGSRDILWSDCRAVGSGDAGIETLHGQGAGFQMRGRRQTLVNPQAVGYDRGVLIAFADHCRVMGAATIENCRVGVHINRAPHVELSRDTIFRDIRETVVNIDSMEDTVSGDLLPGLILRGRVEGATPVGVNIENDGGTQGDDWVVDLKMPDVIIPFAGGPMASFEELDSSGGKNLTGGFTESSYDAGTIASGNFQPDPLLGNVQHYVNNGAHSLVPPSSPSRLIVECTNGATAGAVGTALFNTVDGDTFDPAVGKLHIFEIEKTKTVSRLNVINTPGISAWSAIQGLGFISRCKLCLDAGDSASYPGSGTVWTDRSGGSPANFNFGAAGASPTFAGTGGALSANEYMLLNGAAYLTYGAANAAWMETLHKNNANATIIAIVNLASSGDGCIMGDDGPSNSAVGFDFVTGITGDNLAIRMTNGVAPQFIVHLGPSAFVNTGVWLFTELSFNEAIGIDGARFRMNNKGFYLANSTYTSPSAAAATYPMQIGAAGNNGNIMVAGTKLAVLAAFVPQLTADEVGLLLSVIGPRWDIG